MVNPYRRTMTLLVHVASEFRKNPTQVNAKLLDEALRTAKRVLQREELQLTLPGFNDDAERKPGTVTKGVTIASALDDGNDLFERI